MPEIVGVRFKRAGKVYYFDPAGVDLKVYDYVVVQTARGVEMGQVTIAPKQVLASEITAELKPIVRKASEEDVKRAQDFAAKEDNALAECAKIITRMKLPMKLVAAEYNLDGSRLTFYFTAEERVDFRDLVRELTAFFKTRIELRQIGPRDQAKQVGGLGRCGRGLCCGSFLTEFTPVSIKMAKEQDLPLDPMKISGVCGRLQCCLSYENAQYREAKALMPRRGQQVNTPAGVGMVIGGNPLKETVLVEMESKAEAEFPLSQITIIDMARGPQQAEPQRVETDSIESRVIEDKTVSQPEVSEPGPQDQKFSRDNQRNNRQRQNIRLEAEVRPQVNANTEVPPANPEDKKEPGSTPAEEIKPEENNSTPVNPEEKIEAEVPKPEGQQ